MSHTCRACNGKRTTEVIVAKMHGGVRCGSEITLLVPCGTCKGRGVVQCDHCDDSGYMSEYDWSTGEYLGETTPCLYCDRGRFAEAQVSIDREKAAHEATLPDRDAEMYERVAAGSEPF